MKFMAGIIVSPHKEIQSKEKSGDIQMRNENDR